VFAILPFLHWSALINEMMHLPEWLNSVENWMKSSEQNAKEITDAFLSDTSASGLIINLIMIALLPALGEEFLFRGVLQKLLHQWFKNVHWAVIVSAVIFSAMHFQFYGFLPRTILGVLFGYLFVITKSLWIPITAHFINNGAAVVAAYLFQQQFLESDYHEFGRTTDFLWVLISAITVVALFFAVYRFSLHQNGQNQNIKGESPGPPP
jgi:membrane protease YdiL (CAAX protease family)